MLNVSLTINPGRGCHYLPKPGSGQAVLSEAKEGGSQKKEEKASQNKEVPLVSRLQHVRPGVTEQDQAKIQNNVFFECFGHLPHVTVSEEEIFQYMRI